MSVPLIQQYSWIYNAAAHTTCVRPYVPDVNGTNTYLASLYDSNFTNGTNPNAKPNEFLLELNP